MDRINNPLMRKSIHSKNSSKAHDSNFGTKEELYDKLRSSSSRAGKENNDEVK